MEVQTRTDPPLKFSGAPAEKLGAPLQSICNKNICLILEKCDQFKPLARFGVVVGVISSQHGL